MSDNQRNRRFSAGQVVATRGVADLMAENPEFAPFVQESLERHLNCDWGDVDAEDQRSNDYALGHGLRLLSAYDDSRFPKHGVATIWIITEADRSATTILFPEEY